MEKWKDGNRRMVLGGDVDIRKQHTLWDGSSQYKRKDPADAGSSRVAEVGRWDSAGRIYFTRCMLRVKVTPALSRRYRYTPLVSELPSN